jgi:sulfite exporter TauE/SafE
MTELPLIFVGGLLGSSHCIGMCGPLALVLGMSETRIAANLRRQLVFSVGRICTYGFTGALAAFAGLWLSQWSWLAVGIQGALALASGVVLVLLGLTTAGVLPRVGLGWLAPQSCSAAIWLKTLLTSPKLPSAFLAGVFTGFIPCGLVYAFVAMAAATGDVVHGWLIMVTFGAGTVPLLVIAGCGGTALSLAGRARVLRIAAWCVVVTGIISIARGASYIDSPRGIGSNRCPLCHHSEPAAVQR